MRTGKNIEPKLKAWLLQGKSITHNQALYKFGTNRLSEYIRRLRNKGMNIECEIKHEGDSSYGVYRLKEKVKVSKIETQQYRRVGV